MVVKIMVPLGVFSITRHPVFRGPKKNYDFDDHPYGFYTSNHDFGNVLCIWVLGPLGKWFGMGP